MTTPTPTADPPPVVTFQGVSKWYGNVIGLNKVSLRIRPGISGLLGPNGAGKSTLLALLATLLQPSAGTIRYGNLAVVGDASTGRWVVPSTQHVDAAPNHAYRHPSLAGGAFGPPSGNVRVVVERVGTDALQDELALIFGAV